MAAALVTGAFALGTWLPPPRAWSRPSATAASVALSDRGVFLLSLAGNAIGTETFEIRSSSDKVEARAEIHLQLEQGSKKIDVRTFPNLVLDHQLNPLNYSWKQKGSQSSQLEVDFRSSPAKVRYKTVSGEDDRRDFQLPKDIVVLDDNVIHHYEIVVARYLMTSGGKQTLRAFIPQEALPGVLNVEEAGAEPATVEGSTVNLRHLVVTTENAQIDLWVDEQQHLQRISIPQAQLEAVRKK